MKQQTSPAIILRRINYGEADRIITFLTPVGKIRALVKGVRRSKSKLAGGIELFSESTITFLQTRGDLSRVISSRLVVYWDGIVGDLPRMMVGYEAMKLLDKIIEDEAEATYYTLLKQTLESLAARDISLEGVEVWFYIRLLKLLGHQVNLKTDTTGVALKQVDHYNFSFDDMCFIAAPTGQFQSDHIKLLRLCLSNKATFLRQVKNIEVLSKDLTVLLKQSLNMAIG